LRALRRRVVAGALLIAVAGCGSSDGPDFAAPTVLGHPSAAPGFALRDAAGRTVALSDFRGRAVLLTFIYSHCPDVCPLMVARLHAALERLGPSARRAHVVAVSVDPAGDTPRAVSRFVTEHDMRGRMTYLIGSRASLAPVWRAYGLGVSGTPEEREVGHSALVLGIDAHGRRRTLYPVTFTVADIAHDIPLLAAA
jgi:protein SCO1/2